MKINKDLVFMGLVSLFAAVFLGGCGNIVLFNPKGPIGDAERFVIIASIALMLIVVIPDSRFLFFLFHISFTIGHMNFQWVKGMIFLILFNRDF